MAEEETFTFVDKRGSAAAEEAPAAAPAASEPEIVDAGNAEEEGDEIPDVYQLLQYVTSLLATEAWHKLGLIAHPQTGEAKADLPQAKVAIDVVADLVTHMEKAPETIFPPNGRRELRNLLNDLRLNYVAQRDKDKE
ncbi:hypothetical protein CCAX7_50410 [Capsulimonas corticalis]|uniref:Uncharacterized protein n=1 Tax=Capsulimonas corticalis TaxID=2219043 RepID=A0A402CPN3_9BACT|nr:DUF1844 domain-containing protein [Capsulimonas corticalis]BDI32990.1 hypothetical protein CCAX7_50410 [Capsulimonas corticalis]